MRKINITCMSFVLVAMVSQAGTIAHWDFNDLSLGAADGFAMPDSDGRTVWREAATDKSGNGNHLTTWDHDWAGFNWSANTAGGTGFSMQNAGDFPAAFTWSAQSAPSGTDVEQLASAAFTVETRFNADAVGSWQTLVGRDGQGLVAGSVPETHEFNLSALALSILPDAGVSIHYVDAAGAIHFTASAAGAVAAGQWNDLAAVSDGSTLSLYLNDVIVSSLDMTGSSADTSLNSTLGSVGSGDWAGTWSVARGMYGGGHSDRFYGSVDDVAISDVALAPGSFVIPEPATLGLLGMVGFGLIVIRRLGMTS